MWETGRPVQSISLILSTTLADLIREPGLPPVPGGSCSHYFFLNVSRAACAADRFAPSQLWSKSA